MKILNRLWRNEMNWGFSLQMRQGNYLSTTAWEGVGWMLLDALADRRHWSAYPTPWWHTLLSTSVSFPSFIMFEIFSISPWTRRSIHSAPHHILCRRMQKISLYRKCKLSVVEVRNTLLFAICRLIALCIASGFCIRTCVYVFKQTTANSIRSSSIPGATSLRKHLSKLSKGSIL